MTGQSGQTADCRRQELAAEIAQGQAACEDARMAQTFPLSRLLSQSLVAFTIEFDNEAERRLPHWTTGTRRAAREMNATWLTSMVMYFNCLCWLPDKGLTVGELERLARTPTNLDGMRRWGYVTVTPDMQSQGKKAPKRDWVVRPTAGGRAAQQIWEPLLGEIEERWQERFGGRALEALRESLGAVVKDLDRGLPDCMPILGYGMVCRGPKAKQGPQETMEEGLPLPALLARVLLAFALEFERESQLSLAICANVLRIMTQEGVKLREVPARSGISKEGVSMAVGVLRKWKLADLAKEGIWQVVRLTETGVEARGVYAAGLEQIEARWEERFGERIGVLRAALEPIVGDGTAEGSPLFQGLEPHPEGWRAKARRPNVLPHFPMVLHRGGFPDGS